MFYLYRVTLESKHSPCISLTLTTLEEAGRWQNDPQVTDGESLRPRILKGLVRGHIK
jgi:hypothetical protein